MVKKNKNMKTKNNQSIDIDKSNDTFGVKEVINDFEDSPI